MKRSAQVPPAHQSDHQSERGNALRPLRGNVRVPRGSGNIEPGNHVLAANAAPLAPADTVREDIRSEFEPYFTAADDLERSPAPVEDFSADEETEARPSHHEAQNWGPTEQIEAPDSRYYIIEEYARGGLGRILSARDRQLDRTVAIKELIDQDKIAEALFLREARITARLQHPGVVPVHEVRRWPSGAPYYVMKLVSGQSLQQRIRNACGVNERLSLLPHAIAAVETVAYAHSQGVIHRDIKPANVMIGDYGETMVIDWGLARDLLYPEEPDPNQTQLSQAPSAAGTPSLPCIDNDPSMERLRPQLSYTGQVVGTPAYMAPEQAKGRDVDERSDIYALGALIYEILCGKPPYHGRRWKDVVRKVRRGPPCPLTDRDTELPPDLVAIVDKAMARDPDDRYASAQELARDLKCFQAGKLVSAHAYSSWALLKRWLSRNRATVLVAATALATLLGFAVMSVGRIVTESDRAETERQQAQQARRLAEQRRNDLLLLQAESWLERDPTAAVAWLKTALAENASFPAMRKLFEQAEAAGVSRHVIDHDGWVHAVAFTSDGGHVASAGMDGTVRLLNVASGHQRILHRDSENGFRTLAISGDGSRLVAGCDGGIAYVWNLDENNREPAWTLRGPPARIMDISIADDGKQLVTRSAAGESWLWQLGPAPGSARVLRTIHGIATISPRGQRLAIRESENTAIVVDIETGRERMRISAPDIIADLEFSPDGENLALQSMNGWLAVADLENSKLSELSHEPHNIRMHWGPLLQFSPSGRYLVTRAPDRQLYLWDFRLQKSRTLRGHTNEIFRAVFAADERFLVSVSDDTTARIWDLHSKRVQVLRGHTDDVVGVAVHPNSDYIATSSFDGTVRIWHTKGSWGRPLPGHVKSSVQLHFAADHSLLSASANGEVKRWNLTTRSYQYAISAGNKSAQPRAVSHVIGDSHVIYHTAGSSEIYRRELGQGTEEIIDAGVPLERIAVATMPHSDNGHHSQSPGIHLAAAGKDGAVYIFRDSVHRISPVPLRPRSPICDLTISPDGGQLAIIMPERAEVWRIGAQGQGALERQRTLALTGHPQVSCAGRSKHAWFSPNGILLAVSGMRSGLSLWHSDSDTVHQIHTERQGVEGVSITADGNMLAAALSNRKIYIWDLHPAAVAKTADISTRIDLIGNIASRNGRPLGTHDDKILQIHFSPDGTTLATSSYDHTAKLWDPRTGAHRVLSGHSDSVNRLAFSPDGSYLATSSRDQTIRVWDLQIEPIPDLDALSQALEDLTSAVIIPGNRPRSL